MLTENTNIDSLNGRFEFGKGSVLVGEINGDELGLDLVFRSYRPWGYCQSDADLRHGHRTYRFPVRADRGLACFGRRARR